MEKKVTDIWNKFSANLKQFIASRISNQSDVDDILQQVFIKIHSRIDTLKDETKIESWIYQITRNTIIDYYRAAKKEVNLSEAVNLPHKDSDGTVIREIADDIKEIICTLPEPYRQALVLTEYKGLSQKELAEKKGISVSGAKSRVQRARKMIKDNLMRCCHYEFDRFGTIIDYHPITCCCCSQHYENNS